MKTAKITASNLTTAILNAAAGTFDFFYAARTCPMALRHGGLEGARAVWAARERRAALQRIYLMKRRKLLRVEKTENRLCCILTEKGELERLKRLIRAAPKHGDRERTLLTFDIPERLKKDRDQFRSFLKSVSFARLHQSVWMSEHACLKPFCEWIQKRGLKRWVRVFTVVAA